MLVAPIKTYVKELKPNKLTTIIKSKWQNAYNSIFNLSGYNPNSGYFTGTYESTTGSSGKYRVIGFVGTQEPDKSVPIVLTIHWKPITGAKGTSDEKMTSTMTGQIYLVDSQDEVYKMELLHNLNVPQPIGSIVKDLNKIGNYTETLIFTTNGSPHPDPKWEPSPLKPSDYIGTWNNKNSGSPTIDNINIIAISADNVVQAIYRSNDSDNIHLLKGFIGDLEPDGAKSLSLVGINGSNNRVISCSGIIDKVSKNTHESGPFTPTYGNFYYDGIYIEGKATGYKNRYTAVNVKGYLMQGPEKDVKTVTSITLDQKRIPLTNNGATEWITTAQIGSDQRQILKFGIDTGGNFNWVNSVQCTTNTCRGHGHVQFNQNNSDTFQWTDKQPEEIDWGSWGKAHANLGKDIPYFIPKEQNPKNDFKLITNFPDTAQFNEYLWDGAITLPADTSLMLKGMSNVLARLISSGSIAPQQDFPVSFYADPEAKTGKIQMGSVDPTLFDQNSKVVLPFNQYHNVDYLWSTSLKSFRLGDTPFSGVNFFCIDTGSSALKGDAQVMSAALKYAKHTYDTTGKYPDIHFQMGTLTATGKIAELVLTADQYVTLIDQGEHAGEKVPQIQPLDGVQGLLIQGSTLINYVYTVFVYNIRIDPKTSDIELYGKEMHLYNLKGRPKVIQA